MASNMNLLFPVITVAIAWRLPAALPLFWTVTTLIAILQQWMIMRHDVEEMEEMPAYKKIFKRLRKAKNEKKS